MTAAEVIASVRPKIGDTIGPNYRWPDAKLLPVITSVRRTLISARPEVLYVSTFTATVPDDLSAAADEMDVVDDVRETIARAVADEVLASERAAVGAGGEERDS